MDNEIIESPEVTEEVVSVDTDTEVQETKEKEPEVESKESFITKLKNKFLGTKEGLEESGDSTSDEDIPDEFTSAAKKAGWDNETIIEIASKLNNEELMKVIPTLLVEETEEEKEEVKEEIKEETTVKVEGKEIDIKALEESLEKRLEAKYQEKFRELEERFSQQEQDRSIDTELSIVKETDDFFDGVSKSFPVFGKTEELLRYPEGTSKAGDVIPVGPAFEARNAVWKTAMAFSKLGMDWKDSLGEALDWYKGKNGEKEIRSKVLKELKSNEKHLSARRTSQQTQKKFENEADEKESVVLEAARKAGISV